MAENNLLIGILIGVFSYCCLYLGKGIQKLGINKIKAIKSLKKKESGIWILGTVLTVMPMFIQWAALFFAPVNVIAPLEGIGLAVLVIFSYIALKEQISKMELAGIALVIAGTFITAFFAEPLLKLEGSQFKPMYFISILAGLAVLETALIFVSRKFSYRFAGILFGFSAGTMMAFQSISKRISVVPGLLFIGTICTFLFAILTLLVTQIGFIKARASQVVPAFTAASILVSSVASIFILSERVNALQFTGIGIIVIGVLLISIFKPPDVEAGKNPGISKVKMK